MRRYCKLVISILRSLLLLSLSLPLSPPSLSQLISMAHIDPMGRHVTAVTEQGSLLIYDLSHSLKAHQLVRQMLFSFFISLSAFFNGL